MDNQHKHIKGYRDLSPEEIALMNEGKELAEQVGAFVEKLQRCSLPGSAVPGIGQLEGRWISIGRTHLQQGFMAIIRAIARPTSF